MKPYYLTTPIYYANDVPHIGHAYTTIAADVLARWKRLSGARVHFLTGTDEHGAKIAQAAGAAGQTPRAYLDRVVAKFQELWTRLTVTPDDFLRTSDARHIGVVQKIFEKLLKDGHIYLGSYEGWYCVPDETFWSESELKEGKCPACGRTVERLKEESYFFKLSAFEAPLLAHFEKHPEFLQPKSRAPEIVQFVKMGLRDLSVSRTKVAWGVPVPSNPAHTVYVWFDALINYISALGYDPAAPGALYKEFWPADVHLVGKEIFRFHAVIWPAMLLALGVPLPRTVFAHGWWTVDGEKMSKSRGNVVDPHRMADEFGVDAFRYFLLREVPFGADGDFSAKALLGRYNAELANALGNLLNRVLNLLEKNFDSALLPAGTGDLLPENADWARAYNDALDRTAFHEALEVAFGLVNRANKYAEDTAPWKMVKTDAPRTHAVLTEMARVLKVAAVTLHPFMPTVTEEMWRQLGEPRPLGAEAARALAGGKIQFDPGQKIRKGNPLFPRKEAPKP
ncbi:MAG TPA: methionine--tRNA ligase [Elusimicrobiota bacterium]|nr:methionine--tRNA ligase [Elusimicrobiota bacterium]HND64326.1 methionine--tRNA ligase [Elusimicrobiota bacterium]